MAFDNSSSFDKEKEIDKISIVIGKIASFFGNRMGRISINRILEIINLKIDKPYYSKAQKISYVLHQLKNRPTDFADFLTILFNQHDLSKQDIAILNQDLMSIGFVFEKGIVKPLSLRNIIQNKISKLKINQLDSSIQRMTEAYATLYIVENTLREFIQNTLEKHFGKDWFEKAIPKDIQKDCKKRYDKERKSPWVSTVENKLLWYSDFNDLRKIIIKEENWLLFQPYFQDQNIVVGKLKDLEFIRNIIAHNRLLCLDDFNKLNLLAKEILMCISKKQV